MPPVNHQPDHESVPTLRAMTAAVFNRFFDAFHLRKAGRWIIFGIIIGLLSGLGASIFFYALQWAEFHTFEVLSGMETPKPAGEMLFHLDEAETAAMTPVRWLFFLLPIVGGLISGVLVYWLAPEAEGHGTDAMIDAFHNQNGNIRSRIPFVKGLATLVTLASGGSAGREGPIAQIGGGIGSWLASALKLSRHDKRILLLAGTAGGLGAIFRAPLGGAITSIEVLYREDLESEALIPSVISSVTAYAVFSAIFGYQHIFLIPNFVFRNPTELLFYAGLGFLCVPVGIFYVKVFYGMRDRVFKPMKIPRFLKPMVGGLFIGILGLAVPQAYGGGWGQIQLALLGEVTVKMMLLIMVVKIFATSFTISSGGSGGVFGPTLFIGGMLGGAFGFTANYFYPEIVTQPGAYVLVGMVAFFAGVANAPIGALLMCCEMTGGYNLLAPLMLVSVIALLFTRRWSIYEKQVDDKFASPAHIGDFTIDVLQDLSVSDAMIPDEEIISIDASMRFSQYQQLIVSTQQNYFPVFNQGELVGIVSLASARSVIFEDALGDVVIVQDMMTKAVTSTPNSNLHDALQLLLESNYEQILITDPHDRNVIVGTLRQEDIIGTYHSEIIRRRKDKQEEIAPAT